MRHDKHLRLLLMAVIFLLTCLTPVALADEIRSADYEKTVAGNADASCYLQADAQSDFVLYTKATVLYYRYVCQKCGTTITVAKTNQPPVTVCIQGGKHRWKRVSEK